MKIMKMHYKYVRTPIKTQMTILGDRQTDKRELRRRRIKKRKEK